MKAGVLNRVHLDEALEDRRGRLNLRQERCRQPSWPLNLQGSFAGDGGHGFHFDSPIVYGW
jgi:hypothetical protein